MFVVIVLESGQLSLQVLGVPEKQTIKIFSSNGSYESSNERVAGWSVGYAFDFFDLKNTQIGLPLVVTKFNRVEGRTMTAARSIWRGLRNSDQNARENRSETVNLGARRRERLMISSCCFISKLSATIAFAPPGPSNLAMVTTKCTNSRKMDFVVGRIRKATVKNKTTQTADFQR